MIVHRYSEDVSKLPVANIIFSLVKLKQKLDKSEARERSTLAQAIQMEQKIKTSMKVLKTAEEIRICAKNLENTLKEVEKEISGTDTYILFVETSKNLLRVCSAVLHLIIPTELTH